MQNATDNVTRFAVTDPRSMDGDSYDVAQRATLQAHALARLTRQALEGANLMARNAQMERNLIETPDDARAPEWDESPQGRRFSQLCADAAGIEAALVTLARAAGYNPKSR